MVKAADLLGEVLRRTRDPAGAARAAALVVRSLFSGGPRAVHAVLANGIRPPVLGPQELYADWVLRYDTIGRLDRLRMHWETRRLKSRPLISVIMPVYDPPVPVLEEAIGSVLSQIYPNWELCIADDASPRAEIREALSRHAARDRRIRLVTRERNGGIAAASNSAFALATGEWVALLDHDDVLRPHALLEVAKALEANPEGEIVYSDEDKIDAEGVRFDPFFKPDHSPTLLRAMNYMNHLTVHRARRVAAAGGWRPALDGSQDYDLNLRIAETLAPGQVVHVPAILYHWRAMAGSVAADPAGKSDAWERGRQALASHLQRIGRPGGVAPVPRTPYYRPEPLPEEALPKVSIVIATRDAEPILRRCIETVRDLTLYPHYEIVVVDNQSRDPSARAYLSELEASGQARVLPFDRPFNYSAINNLGVRAARHPVIVLLNNDIEVISPHWLAEMASHAQDPGVGAVGAKLRYRDGSIQHAGVVLGIGGVAGHAHKHAPADAAGYFGRLLVAHEVSAVTGACLLVRKSVFESVGGLDEAELPIAFNDVDLCLKLREAGYRNIVAPFAELHHMESATRGPEDDPVKRDRFERESAVMRRRWGRALTRDPFYSPSLTLEREDLSLAFPPAGPARGRRAPSIERVKDSA